ncbi:Hypothetical predicted protein [Podarcis lilfordi]|uniref:Uncharacterized protein n=1 Tax=Podarcis lilfordi TaxID=74358 RepID=A0AA35KF66_9SAUR|nr:Hypothetical predicted protein [Podarcis lilfordi]
MDSRRAAIPGLSCAGCSRAHFPLEESEGQPAGEGLVPHHLEVGAWKGILLLKREGR